MKQIVLFFLLATAAFAENLTLENQTSYPAKNSKIAIQWATSAKEVDEHNQASIQGMELNSATLQVVTRQGTVKLTIPKKAEYFRVLVWPNGEGNAELLTNWVDVIPNKTYLLKTEHLVPVLLMSGMGC